MKETEQKLRESIQESLDRISRRIDIIYKSESYDYDARHIDIADLDTEEMFLKINYSDLKDDNLVFNFIKYYDNIYDYNILNRILETKVLLLNLIKREELNKGL